MLVVAGVALCIAGTAIQVVAYRTRSLLLSNLSLAWLLLVLATGIALGVLALKHFIASERRPTRFVADGTGFWASTVFPPGFIVFLLLLLAANNYAQVINKWNDADRTFAIVGTALGVLMTPVLAMLVTHAWRATTLKLTPDGVTVYTPLLRRTIPWEALAAGGPPRPLTTANRLQLITTRPELVSQRGWPVMSGTRQVPAIPLQLNVHPWFVADAIRWYAEHPEDRPAIGQPAEHDRLLAAIVARPAA
ncbi:hypothetical protein Rhe02_18970 [Rhizocola hellebori]|uniref:Uncharacterized protein n=1 Tax=Rhizocola hellebori TaxID=1392758 RepID=A0A8J3Q620_9ACTN|nr:hypothetical protein Rhe02_18970 [Rhizocola hellebori]